MDLLRSLPLGLYLEQPITWLHRLDPRVKLAWLLSFLAAPIMANSVCRVVLVVLLILLTLAAAIPLRVWRQQMGWLLTISFFILVIGAISPDGMGVDHQSRLPTVKDSEILNLSNEFNSGVRSQENAQASPASPASPSPKNPSPSDYRYVLFQQGPCLLYTSPSPRD